MNMSKFWLLYFFQVHRRGLGNMLIFSVIFLCFLLAWMQRWIKQHFFREDCLLYIVMPFKALCPFQQITSHSRDLGWFRCGFWISRKSLSCTRKMVVDMTDQQLLCLCACVCLGISICTRTYMFNCMCLWRKLVKVLLVYSILFRNKTRLLVFSESLGKWNPMNT